MDGLEGKKQKVGNSDCCFDKLASVSAEGLAVDAALVSGCLQSSLDASTHAPAL